jgi:hypothetical protein
MPDNPKMKKNENENSLTLKMLDKPNLRKIKFHQP